MSSICFWHWIESGGSMVTSKTTLRDRVPETRLCRSAIGRFSVKWIRTACYVLMIEISHALFKQTQTCTVTSNLIKIDSRTNFGKQRVCGWRCGRRYYWKTNDPIYDLRNLTFRYRNRIFTFSRISASGFRARIKASMMIPCLAWKNSNYTWPRQLLCTPYFR